MTSSPPPPPPPDPKAKSLSFFRKTACLFDWWLIKTDSEFRGKRLGVAGSTSFSTYREKQQAVRVFSSAAIAKRFDVFTLETVDGVSVVLKGFINKQRTLDNGFPTETFKDFVFGFPPNWENYAEKCCTGEDSTTGVSGLENSSSGIQCSLEETPKKKERVIHEDRKEEDFSEDQSHKVSGNVTIDSQVCNFRIQHADEKKGKINVAPIGYRRCSQRLRNRTGKQEIPTSRCSRKDDANVCPTSGTNIKTQDNNKLNGLFGGTIQSGKTLDVSGSSPVHLSAKIRNKTKEKRIIVCGLKTENNKLSPLPVVFDPEKNLVQNELGDGRIPVSSGNELQELVDANMAEKLADGSVKDGPDCRQQSSNWRKPKNTNTKAVIETDARDESTPRKKTKRKIIFEKQVSPQSPEEKEKTSTVSPECSTFGRSRSGRLLLPAMQFWRNQIPVYDLDRTLIKIQGDLPVRVPVRGSGSEPQKKRKR